MGIKTYRPYTPSRRHMTGSDFAEVTKVTNQLASSQQGDYLGDPNEITSTV